MLTQECFDRNGRPVIVHRTEIEDGIEFAIISYPDGYLPHPVGGRAGGTEEKPLWEHRVLDGVVMNPGGDYYRDADWHVERGLRTYSADDKRANDPPH
jgi:hypothetical protein